jgi:pentapeptide repeat protein
MCEGHELKLINQNHPDLVQRTGDHMRLNSPPQGVRHAAMVCVPEAMELLRCGPAEWTDVLRRGPRVWNAWREHYPWIIPDLSGIAPTLTECQLGPLSGGPINLATARLRGARLRGATLSEANLEGADLSDADLTYVRLDRANLSYANLRNANLDKTDLAGARLMRADLSGANLAHARSLTQGQLFGSIGNSLTVLPPSLERPESWLQVASEIHDVGSRSTERDLRGCNPQSLNGYDDRNQPRLVRSISTMRTGVRLARSMMASCFGVMSS